MQRRAHGLAEPDLRQLQHAFHAGDGFQTAMVAAVTALAVGIDLRVADFDQATASGMQKASVGDDARPDVMVNHHLNHVPCAAGCAKQRLRHRPGADVMLNIDRHAGVIFQHLAQRHLFNIVVERHAVHDSIFGINNTRHGDRNGR